MGTYNNYSKNGVFKIYCIFYLYFFRINKSMQSVFSVTSLDKNRLYNDLKNKPNKP